jgi:hypothetical protein
MTLNHSMSRNGEKSNYLDEGLSFSIPLSFSAHSVARRLSSKQSNSQKANQVYLNSLAVYAVDSYLRCLGIETEIKRSDSYNPISLMLMDVADLYIKGLGKLECRPVLPDSTVCQIPPEVWSDRIGYVAVRISQSLKQAEIIGFTQNVPITQMSNEIAEIPLTQLQSIEEFLEYLNPCGKLPVHSVQANLRQWLENLFEESWQDVNSLLSPNQLPLAFRGIDNFGEVVERAKVIHLDSQGNQQTVVLVVKLRSSEEDINITVEIFPKSTHYLPESMHVKVIDAEKIVQMQAVTDIAHQDIELSFKVKLNEQFSLEMSFRETTIVEYFSA